MLPCVPIAGAGFRGSDGRRRRFFRRLLSAPLDDGASPPPMVSVDPPKPDMDKHLRDAAIVLRQLRNHEKLTSSQREVLLDALYVVGQL